jgi:predicted DCC family thiol-disulfide oxidoreductase YuxK
MVVAAAAELPGSAVPASSATTPILFFDGECGFCDRSIRFVMARDTGARLRVAPLGGITAAAVLPAFAAALRDVDSVVLYLPSRGADEASVLVYSDAALRILRELGGWWMLPGVVGALVPRWIRDACYKVIAARRMQLFGRITACEVWPSAWHARVLP